MVNSSLQNLLNYIVYTMILIYVQMFLNFFLMKQLIWSLALLTDYFFFLVKWTSDLELLTKWKQTSLCNAQNWDKK